MSFPEKKFKDWKKNEDKGIRGVPQDALDNPIFMKDWRNEIETAARWGFSEGLKEGYENSDYKDGLEAGRELQKSDFRGLLAEQRKALDEGEIWKNEKVYLDSKGKLKNEAKRELLGVLEERLK